MVKFIYITKYIRSLKKLNTSLEINYYMRLIWDLLSKTRNHGDITHLA